MKGKRLKAEIRKCKKEFLTGREGNPWFSYICEKGIDWKRVVNGARRRSK